MRHYPIPRSAAILFLILAFLLHAAEGAEPEKTAENAVKPEAMPPVKGFNIKYNFDNGGKFQIGPLKESSDWRVSDFFRPGKVRVENNVLYLEKGNDMTGVTWRGPLARMNYEITLEAMRVDGSDFFCGLTFPVNNNSCSLILGGWGGTVTGLSSIDGEDAANNSTTRSMKFENNKWYSVRVRVYGEKIEAWVEDERLVNYVFTGHTIGIRWEMEVCVPLGIATWQTSGAIRNMEYKVLPAKPFDYEVKK